MYDECGGVPPQRAGEVDMLNSLVSTIPLTVLPLIAFNVVAFIFGYDVWSREVFGLTMISGQRWAFVIGDLMIVFGLGCLFFEVLRSTSSGARIITNHILSTVVLIVFLIEFIVVQRAAHSVFFILMSMAVFDVMAGFTITIKAAQRDVSYTRPPDNPH
jgi:hypothetical protein